MNFLIPTSFIILRLSIMLIPYLVLYRISNCFNLEQGKLSQLSEQYWVLLLINCSQFLILHAVRYFDFWLSWLSILKQPGHVFYSRIYPQQRRQFIPHGVIKLVGIVFVFFRCVIVMIRLFNFVSAQHIFYSRFACANTEFIAAYCIILAKWNIEYLFEY